jgi:CDP-diacylglycerol--serine O-phosphatidyltransferase
MRIQNHIPNFITCCNLLCGCYGIVLAFNGHTEWAVYLIVLACLFDFLDGFAARILKATSPIGKDLDSLADMVTFGVLPGLLMFHMLDSHFHFVAETGASNRFLVLASLLIPVFSALRLAKFNNDVRQSDKFIGLPTPANALFLGSLAYLSVQPSADYYFIAWLLKPGTLVLITLFFSFLLVAELPLIALKFKNFGWKDNKMRYSLLLLSLVLAVWLKFAAVPAIIILYLVFSLIENKRLDNSPGAEAR